MKYIIFIFRIISDGNKLFNAIELQNDELDSLETCLIENRSAVKTTVK